jgi:hypothetical protein
METRQSTAQGQSSGQPSSIRASRPRAPAEYGIPETIEGLLHWSHVQERMNSAKHYWVCTVSPGGRPHATPVDGLWLDDQLYFGGSPQTRWYRNLAANAAVCIHLESGSDVVTLHGEAPLSVVERALARRLSDATAAKYGYQMKPEDYEGGVFVFRPRLVFAWTQYPQDVTRWTIERGGSAQ